MITAKGDIKMIKSKIEIVKRYVCMKGHNNNVKKMEIEAEAAIKWLEDYFKID